MKAEIELSNGECVELVFDWTWCKAEPDVGYMDDWFEFEADYYTPINEEGERLPQVDANDLEITPHIQQQLANAVTEYQESNYQDRGDYDYEVSKDRKWEAR